MYKPSSPWTWAFAIVSLVQAAIVLGFEAYAFVRFQTGLQGNYGGSSPTHTIPTFLALYIFGFVYQLILVYDALRLKNTIQVIGLCLYNVGLLIYAAVQMDQIQEAVTQLSKDSLIEPSVYGIDGSHRMEIMKRRYLTFQIYIALLKFDFFFFLGFSIQFVVVVVKHSTIEFYLTIAAIPVTIIILLMAGYFTRKENTPGMLAIIVRLPYSPPYPHIPSLFSCPPDIEANRDITTGSLLRRPRLLPLQALPDVLTRPPEGLRPRSPPPHHLRRHHRHPHHPHHRQRMHVHRQFRARAQTAYRGQEARERGREVCEWGGEWDGDDEAEL
ncbi:MAG: hypothetical protein Q9218_004000 [Villophora microphyllina]